ncbi:MAG TPA: metal ABC transporter substrate-binding protein [Candidatus Avimonas sp.]|nr:metal ABC transporter substrate-binding protein [Candidatus Avimonas sp.]
MALSYKSKLGIIAAIMALMTALAVMLTFLTGTKQTEKSNVNIVTSFMPVYTAALQVTKGVDGVYIECLAPPKTGCLHDYQLTPENAISLSKADILVINGAGAESFLGDVTTNYPNLRIVDTSEGVNLIEISHDHDHGHGHDDEFLYNEHIWTSPSNYIKQVENLRDGLARLIPENAEKFRQNADEYISEIQSIKSELLQAASSLPTLNCILFHDSLAYFAKELGLNTIASFSIGEDTALSAGDLARAADAAKKAGKVLLLYDDQYDTEYSSVAEKAEKSLVLKLDTAVLGGGVSPENAWINAMRNNLQLLKSAAEN